MGFLFLMIGIMLIPFFILPLNPTEALTSLIKILSFCFLTMSELLIYAGNSFFFIYVAEVFPTNVRHFAYGILYSAY